jgi:methionyl-tRNA synthetase
MDKVELKDSLKTILDISHATNKYVDDTKTWELFKTDIDRCYTVFHILNHIAVLIARLLEPFMPETSKTINSFVMADKPYRYKYNSLELDIITGKSTNKPQILFKKITDDQIDELRSKYGD